MLALAERVSTTVARSSSVGKEVLIGWAGGCWEVRLTSGKSEERQAFLSGILGSGLELGIRSKVGKVIEGRESGEPGLRQSMAGTNFSGRDNLIPRQRGGRRWL